MKTFSILLIFTTTFAFAQQNNFILNYNNYNRLESYSADSSYNCNYQFKPIILSNITYCNNFIYKYYNIKNDSLYISKKKHKFLLKKLLTESLIETNNKNFNLEINPYFNFEFGYDTLKRLTVNSRGVIISGNLSSKFSFFTGVIETQSFSEKYISDYIKFKHVSPGEARSKLFKNTGYDYSYSFGNISYTPVKSLNIQLGHGKHFIGDGYRSLLLSDFASNYPFFKTTVTLKKIQYVNLISAFQNISTTDNREFVYQRKHGSFIFLNYLPSTNFQIGLFEATIFQTTDNNSNNNVPLNFFDPIIGEKTIQYGFRGNNNCLIGLTGNIVFFKHYKFYAQFLLDDYKRNSTDSNYNNRFGFQLGLKISEPFKIKSLYLFTEYNKVSPYTYFSTNGNQNYTAYNEPLAHPLGNNFNEIIFGLNYNYKNLIFNFKYSENKSLNNFSNISYNTAQNLSEIDFINLYINTKNIFFETALLINHKSNMQLAAGIHYRKNNNINSTFYYFSLKTNIFNHYLDY